MRQSLDLHCHTNVGSTCSDFSIEDMREWQESMGLPSIAITDHHSVAGAEALRNEGCINVIAGAEIWIRDSISRDYGEYLIFTTENLKRMLEPVEYHYNRPSITLLEARNRDLLHPDNLIVWCHPPYDIDDWFRFCVDHMNQYVNAVEIANYTSHTNIIKAKKVIEEAGLGDLPQLANSDAHKASDYMQFYNDFPFPIPNVEDLIKTVKSKKFSRVYTG